MPGYLFLFIRLIQGVFQFHSEIIGFAVNVAHCHTSELMRPKTVKNG
jgi:hypothetical protein